MQGMGDAKTPLLLLCVFVFLNVILNGVFAMGWWGFPPLGIAGIALATGTAWLLGAAVMLALFWRKGLLRATPSEAPRTWSLWAMDCPSHTFGGVVRFNLARFNALGRPRWGAGIGGREHRPSPGSVRLHDLRWFRHGHGRVGWPGGRHGQRSVGASGGGLRAARWAFGFNAVWVAVLLLHPDFFFGLFTEDPEVWHFGLAYLSLAAIATPFQAWDTIFNDAFAGSGRAVSPWWLTCWGMPCESRSLGSCWTFGGQRAFLRPSGFRRL